MGLVVSALDGVTNRRVAVKMVSPSLPDSPLLRARLLDEASLHLGLCVPGLVRATSSAITPLGAPLLVLELVEGESLRAATDATDLDRLRWLTQLASTLGALHRRGVVHLDVKPDNVIVRRGGTATLIDLGLARVVGAPSLGRVANGTPPYAAPEVVTGAPPDPRTDVFALGVTALEVLTGTLPWSDPEHVGNERQRWLAPLRERAPRLADHRPDLGGALDAALAMATSADPRERCLDAPALARAFETAASSLRLRASRGRHVAAPARRVA